MAEENRAMQLTPAKLAELRRMYDAATRGEWRPESGLTWGSTVWAQDTRTGSMMVASCGHANFDAHNAALVAAMHNALPALLDMAGRVERLERIERTAFSLWVNLMDGCSAAELKKSCAELDAALEATK